jgi:hypothetical protein
MLDFKIKKDSKIVWLDNSTADTESKISAVKIFQIEKNSIVHTVHNYGEFSRTKLTFKLKTGEEQEVILFEN